MIFVRRRSFVTIQAPGACCVWSSLLHCNNFIKTTWSHSRRGSPSCQTESARTTCSAAASASTTSTRSPRASSAPGTSATSAARARSALYISIVCEYTLNLLWISTDVNIGEHLHAGRLRQPPGGEWRGGAVERGGRGQLAHRCRQPGRRVTLTAEVNAVFFTISLQVVRATPSPSSRSCLSTRTGSPPPWTCCRHPPSDMWGSCNFNIILRISAASPAWMLNAVCVYLKL